MYRSIMLPTESSSGLAEQDILEERFGREVWVLWERGGTTTLSTKWASTIPGNESVWFTASAMCGSPQLRVNSKNLLVFVSAPS